MGSPHDPSITIVCICHLEEKHSCGGLIPLQECLALMLQMIFSLLLMIFTQARRS